MTCVLWLMQTSRQASRISHLLHYLLPLFAKKLSARLAVLGAVWHRGHALLGDVYRQWRTGNSSRCSRSSMHFRERLQGPDLEGTSPSFYVTYVAVICAASNARRGACLVR